MGFDWMSACFEKLIAPAPAQLSFALLSLLGQVSIKTADTKQKLCNVIQRLTNCQIEVQQNT